MIITVLPAHGNLLKFSECQYKMLAVTIQDSELPLFVKERIIKILRSYLLIRTIRATEILKINK